MPATRPRRVLFIVENLPVPADRRVWEEATTLRAAGYEVSVICPTGKAYTARHEVLDGIHIYRHTLPMEARGAAAYLVEYGAALFWQFVLAWRVFLTRGFDAIHACNPPDNIFLVAMWFKPFGVRYVFDQHDVCPEMFESKFGGRGPLYQVMLLWERLTFWLADVAIVPNESHRRVAIERGRMAPERVHVVRSGPNLARLRRVDPDPAWRRGRQYLVAYVGVMGKQDGVDLLLEGVRYVVHDLHRTDIQFVLLGDGPEFDALQALADALDVAPYVTFAGFVSDTERLCSALSTADACVTPDPSSPYNDLCTMNKIMEYMALGKPQVQFDLPEGHASAGDTSLYAASGDVRDLMCKVMELLQDPERARALGDAGRRRVEDVLQWTHEQPKLLAAYDQLFAQ